MSEEQEYAVAGRTLKEYADCKRTLAALQLEAGRFGKALGQVGNALATSSTLNTPGFVAVTFVMNEYIPSFPTAETLLSITQGIKIELDRKHALSAQLKNMGYEPKE